MAEVEKSDETNVDYDVIISAVRDVKSAPELEEAITEVKPGSGSCRTRRLLKRAIEQVLTKEEIEKSMNAKVRRRVNRVVKLLSPGENDAVKVSSSSTDQVKGSNTAAVNNKSLQESENVAKTIVPYVVFCGQLSYDTTIDELRQFFISKGINGEIKIRLLTDKENKKSRGMAFIELDNAIEMHKCVALHKSILKGKALNIEKSCGGKSKEKRQSKIKEHRDEQTQKLNEAVDRILAEYSKSKVIEPEKFGEGFKTKLYWSGPYVLGKVLAAYSKLPQEKRLLTKLDQMLDKYQFEQKHLSEDNLVAPIAEAENSM